MDRCSRSMSVVALLGIGVALAAAAAAEEHEAQGSAAGGPLIQGPAPPTSEPGEAVSPMEEVEAELAVRYGHLINVTYRGQFDDKQAPAARPEDFSHDPSHRGFIPIPNTVFMIKFNAKPRLDLTADSARAGSEFRFVPALFPVEGMPDHAGGWRFNANGNGSQLRMDIRAPSAPGSFRLYYQNDFFGSDTRNMQYRLQHLYGQFHGVLGGFTYGIFENPDAWPDTVDYEGPNSVVFARRPLLHYTLTLAENWHLTLGVEDPDIFVDTTGDPGATRRNRAPDGGFNIRWTPGDLGHVQASALFRSIGIDGVLAPSDDVFGWGVNLSGAVELTSRDTLQYWFVYGDGVGGMGNDTSFMNSDAALDAAGHLVALEYLSTMVALTHRWTPRWRSTAVHGYVKLQNTALQSGDAYHFSHYASVNLIYQVFKRLSVGVEGLYGYKEVKSRAGAEVFRIQLGLSFSIFD